MYTKPMSYHRRETAKRKAIYAAALLKEIDFNIKARIIRIMTLWSVLLVVGSIYPVIFS